MGLFNNKSNVKSKRGIRLKKWYIRRGQVIR